MAELADALRSGRSESNLVQVRFLLSAPQYNNISVPRSHAAKTESAGYAEE